MIAHPPLFFRKRGVRGHGGLKAVWILIGAMGSAMGSPYSSGGGYSLLQAPAGVIAGGGPVSDGLGTPVITVDVSVGEMEGGAVSDVSGSFPFVVETKANLVGQFYDVTGLSLASYPDTVLQGETQSVDAFMRMDDWTLVPLDAGEVVWSVAAGPITVDGLGVVTGGTVTANTLATVQGDWLAFTPATLDLTVLFAIPTLPGNERDWEQLLGGGTFDAGNPLGGTIDQTMVGFRGPLLGASTPGDRLSLDFSFDGSSVGGGGTPRFGFQTLGSNLGEGIVVLFNDTAKPGGDTVRLESLLTGQGMDFPVGDFSGSGTLDFLFSVVLRPDGQWDFFLRVTDNGTVILDEGGLLWFMDMIGDGTIQAIAGSPTGTVTGIVGTFSGTDPDAGTGQRFDTLLATPGGGGGPVAGMLGAAPVLVDSSVSDEADGATSDTVLDGGGLPQFARGNLIGQFYDPAGFLVSASPATVDEGETRQLVAAVAMDDETVVGVDESDVLWSVVDGPVVGIDAGGLATAGLVYEDTLATVRGDYGGVMDDFGLTVLNVGLDDFGSYAGDGIDDDWQVGFFGENNPNAGPGKNPDGDPNDNLTEFLGGFDPTNGSDFLQLLIVGVGGGVTDLTLNKAIPGRTYRLMESGDLTTPFSEVEKFSVVSEELDKALQDGDAPTGRNFYQIKVERP